VTRKILILMISSALCFSCTKSPCQDSIYHILDDTVQMGESKETAISKAKSAFGDKAKYDFQSDGSFLVFFKKPYENLQLLSYHFRDDKVVRIAFLYHEDYIKEIGGPYVGLAEIVERYKGKYGSLSSKSMNESEGTLSAEWGYDSSGMKLSLMAKGTPEMIVTRFDCSPIN